MRQLINLAGDPWSLAPFADAAALRAFYEGLGCDGVELILCGDELGGKLLPGMVGGLHLLFYPEWIHLWRGDTAYLDAEFGSRAAWQEFYGAADGAGLLDAYRRELDMAEALGAEYVVFHMGDNALGEYFTLAPQWTAEEQIAESCAFLNALLAGRAPSFDLLLENMWLGCMNLTDPRHTQLALEGVRYPRTGLMLDTGHLMATRPDLHDLEDGCAAVHRMLDAHGPLAKRIWGLHLHASLGGAYAARLPLPPPDPTLGYLERYSRCHRHLAHIDQHRPFEARGLAALVARINPKYLCHELAHPADPAGWGRVVRRQKAFLDGAPPHPKQP